MAIGKQETILAGSVFVNDKVGPTQPQWDGKDIQCSCPACGETFRIMVSIWEKVNQTGRRWLNIRGYLWKPKA